MYRFDAEDPGQSLYTPTTTGVITLVISYYLEIHNIWHALNLDTTKGQSTFIVKVKIEMYRFDAEHPGQFL